MRVTGTDAGAAAFGRLRRRRVGGVSTVQVDPGLAVQLDFVALLTQEERVAIGRPMTPFGQLPEFPVGLFALWRLRSDLSAAFDLKTAEGATGLWSWAVRDGRRELPLVSGLVEQAREALVAPVDTPSPDSLPVPFTWIAAITWLTRPDLQESFPMESDGKAVEYLAWFLRLGMFEVRCSDLLAPKQSALMAAASPSSSGLPIVNFLILLHSTRPDLQARFDLGTPEGRRDYVEWFCEAGCLEVPVAPAVLDAQRQAFTQWKEKPAIDTTDDQQGNSELS